MVNFKRVGIIDIGSNSIRLVINEETEHGAHHVIDESKNSARLSGRIGPDGILKQEDQQVIAQILNYFKKICEANRTTVIRAVATAAIRNATNSIDILNYLTQETGLKIELLSGEEEARLGFLGMINTIDLEEGFLVDIGGGSTEISLFHNRSIVKSVSFPFGSVNTTKRYTRNGNVDAEDIGHIHSMVTAALEKEKSWLHSHKGLPLVGLGGTIRSICKLDQRQKKYSLPLTHNYDMDSPSVDRLVLELSDLSVENRKKVEGMSKDRADIIVPGLIILQTIYRYIGSSFYKISGSGLRDGLYYEIIYPQQPKITSVLKHSVRNLLALHPSVPSVHVEHINKFALKLYDEMNVSQSQGTRSRDYLDTASLLYRIGVTVLYYEYAKHTFYLMAHSRIDGLSHREILICAFIASYKNKNRTKKMCLEYKDIITEADFQFIEKLGMLLQLAIALDRSETQPIQSLSVFLNKKELVLQMNCSQPPIIEMREVQLLQKEFKKTWELQLSLTSKH
jgi:exopolyphosphatase/guanosine-5'-triphosphate,3'-diphosphate pyrophosphatase